MRPGGPAPSNVGRTVYTPPKPPVNYAPARPTSLADYDKLGLSAPNDPRKTHQNQLMDDPYFGLFSMLGGTLDPYAGQEGQWTQQNGVWGNSYGGGQPQAPRFDFAGNPLGPGGAVYTEDLGGMNPAGAYNPPPGVFNTGIEKYLGGGRTFNPGAERHLADLPPWLMPLYGQGRNTGKGDYIGLFKQLLQDRGIGV